jgi:glyoxylase-like metal-dependent hydrolase (beta-lactamase superfamily II)
VTPAGESLLVDTGYGAAGGRDSTRILAAARAAGVKAIDYLLMTHFHPDHDGGVVELSRQMPIKTFFDQRRPGCGARKRSPKRGGRVRSLLTTRTRLRARKGITSSRNRATGCR